MVRPFASFKNTSLVFTLGLAVSAVLSGCGSTSSAHTPSSVAVGDITKVTLNSNYPLFNVGYQAFGASQEQLRLVDAWPDNLNVDIYFGTWCHDSQREVPKFLKLVTQHQAVNGKNVAYRLIALDYKKQEPAQRARGEKVKYTPTFIVKLGDKEIGRIVENTQRSYAHDISEMIKTAKQ